MALGLGSYLVALATGLELARGNPFADLNLIERIGDELFGTMFGEWSLDQLTKRGQPFGFAHGVCGELYAMLRWSRARSWPLGAPVLEALDRLTSLAGGSADVLRLPRSVGSNDYVPSWCNGSAGYVLLFTSAYGMTREEKFIRAAAGFAADAIQSADERLNLCCGCAGRAFALLALYQITGESKVLAAARDLCDRAQAQEGSSLFNGAGGPAILAFEMESVGGARMPILDD